MEVVDIDDIRMRLAQPRIGIEMALEAYAWLKRSGDLRHLWHCCTMAMRMWLAMLLGC